jgi:hypothetical protein
MWMNRIAQHIAKQRAQITDKLNAKVNPFLNQIKGSKLGKKVFNNSKQQSREYTNHLSTYLNFVQLFCKFEYFSFNASC